MQGEFNFGGDAPGADGLTLWRREREEALRRVGRANGLPLGRRCRVELVGAVLEGTLLLAEEELLPPGPVRNPQLRLRVGSRTFAQHEILAVTRLD